MLESNDVMIIKESGFFKDFHDGDFETLCEKLRATRKSFAKGETLIKQGESAPAFAILLSGKAISEKYHYSGSLHILKYSILAIS
jgi:hypothetical protein